MSSQQDVHNIYVPFIASAQNTTGEGGTTAYYKYAFRSPTAANGGGVTILNAYAMEYNTAHAAGSAMVFRLLTYSGGGTPAVAGTIATYGTLTAAGTPLALTVATPFVNANQWVVVEAAAAGTSPSAINIGVTVQYVMGY